MLQPVRVWLQASRLGIEPKLPPSQGGVPSSTLSGCNVDLLRPMTRVSTPGSYLRHPTPSFAWAEANQQAPNLGIEPSLRRSRRLVRSSTLIGRRLGRYHQVLRCPCSNPISRWGRAGRAVLAPASWGFQAHASLSQLTTVVSGEHPTFRRPQPSRTSGRDSNPHHSRSCSTWNRTRGGLVNS